MLFRTAGAIATVLMGLCGQASAQYYPSPPAYPRLPPAVNADGDLPPLNAPVVQGDPLPPVGVEPAYQTPAPYPADAAQPLSPGTQSYQAVQPQDYGPTGTRPYYGMPGAIPPGPPASAKQDAIREEALRSRMRISPGQIGSGPVDTSVTGTTEGGEPRDMAAFPPEVRPESEPKEEVASQFRRTLVDYQTMEPAGTIIVDTPNTYLYLVLGAGKALRYGVGVGREGFTWSGAERVTRTLEWPDWTPPEEMIVRQPYLPRFMAGGETNPLGARALYLGNTIYRIHGTNQPSTIGSFVSSGCIRLTNEDVIDLYRRIRVGTRVVVLPGKASRSPSAMQLDSAPPPASTTANGAAPPGAVTPGTPMAR